MVDKSNTTEVVKKCSWNCINLRRRVEKRFRQTQDASGYISLSTLVTSQLGYMPLNIKRLKFKIVKIDYNHD